MTTQDGRRRLVAQLPEPARLWITHAPRGWAAAEQPFVHLGSGRLTRPRGEAEWQPVVAASCDGVVYVPPVSAELGPRREALVEQLVSAATQTLVQVHPGEVCEVRGAWMVYDLLPCLLAGDLGPLSELPQGCDVVWPLIAGVTDEVDGWQDGCRRLAACGVRTVQALAAEVLPVDRQWLVEDRTDEVFDRLFHGPEPSERAFAHIASEHGLAPFVARPAIGEGRTQRNHALGAALALAGELWLRMGRRESMGQALLRAARGADTAAYDLAALAEDGNLGVLDWLDEASQSVVTDVLANGASALVGSLIEAYLGQDE